MAEDGSAARPPSRTRHWITLFLGAFFLVYGLVTRSDSVRVHQLSLNSLTFAPACLLAFGVYFITLSRQAGKISSPTASTRELFAAFGGLVFFVTIDFMEAGHVRSAPVALATSFAIALLGSGTACFVYSVAARKKTEQVLSHSSAPIC